MATSVSFYYSVLDRDHRNIARDKTVFDSALQYPLFSVEFPGDIVPVTDGEWVLSVTSPDATYLPNYCAFTWRGMRYTAFVDSSYETNSTIRCSLTLDWLGTYFYGNFPPDLYVNTSVSETSDRPDLVMTYPDRPVTGMGAAYRTFSVMDISFAVTIRKKSDSDTQSQQLVMYMMGAFDLDNESTLERIPQILRAISRPTTVYRNDTLLGSAYVVQNVRNVQILPRTLTAYAGVFVDTPTKYTFYDPESATRSFQFCAVEASDTVGGLGRPERAFGLNAHVGFRGQAYLGNYTCRVPLKRQSNPAPIYAYVIFAGDHVELMATQYGDEWNFTQSTYIPIVFSDDYAQYQSEKSANALGLLSSGLSVAAAAATANPVLLAGAGISLISTIEGQISEGRSEYVSASGFWKNIVLFGVLGMMTFPLLNDRVGVDDGVIGCAVEKSFVGVNLTSILSWVGQYPVLSGRFGYARFSNVSIWTDTERGMLPSRYISEIVETLEGGVKAWATL